MPKNRWKSFDAFNPNHWSEKVGDASFVSNAIWEQPIWADRATSFALPNRCIASPEQGNPWQLQQSIRKEHDVMPALMHGASGLRFDVKSRGCSMNCLEGVHLNMVQLHMDVALFLDGSWDVQSLLDVGWRGTCGFPITASMTIDSLNNHHTLLADGPDLRIWQCGQNDHRHRSLSHVEALAEYCELMDLWLEMAKDSFVSIHHELDRFVWRWWTSVDVLEEVAALRALRALWSRWLLHHQLADRPIWIDATTSTASFRNELETDHLIDLTTASYAAVLGGADGVETVPHSRCDENQAFDDSAQRWARNIQHLMREEAGLHRTFDPMGGSRTVETWSSNMLEAAWSIYLNSKS
tara:strand:- start:1434 stop:2492 length:1059 start_codon:yes stop_codon:yes gene_type:complete